MDVELKEAIVSVVKEGNADVVSKISEIESKVKSLEDRPIAQKEVSILIPREYKGYRLNSQLEKFRSVDGANQVALDAVSKMILELATAGANNQQMTLKAAANQVEGTDAAGGYLTIDEFDNIITKTARNMSVMMPLVDNRTVSRTDTFKYNKQLANVSLAWDAEGTVTNTSATYSQSSIAIKRLSGYASMSNELLMDSAYDVVGDITEQFSYAMAQEMDNQILNGTGTPCSGVLTAAAGTSTIIAYTNWSSVAAADFSLALSALSTVDQANATFILGKKGAHWVRTLKDTNNAPVYQAVAGPNLNTLFGTPFVVANKINDATGGTGGFYAVVGDFRQFFLINRLGALELLVDPYSDSVSYNTRFVWATRKGLGIKRADAFNRMGTT